MLQRYSFNLLHHVSEQLNQSAAKVVSFTTPRRVYVKGRCFAVLQQNKVSFLGSYCVSSEPEHGIT